MKHENEAAFEKHLRELISSEITRQIPAIYALDNRTVGDIVICRDGARPAIFFLEVKYFQRSKARLGFGNSRGEGI